MKRSSYQLSVNSRWKVSTALEISRRSFIHRNSTSPSNAYAVYSTFCSTSANSHWYASFMLRTRRRVNATSTATLDVGFFDRNPSRSPYNANRNTRKVTRYNVEGWVDSIKMFACFYRDRAFPSRPNYPRWPRCAPTWRAKARIFFQWVLGDRSTLLFPHPFAIDRSRVTFSNGPHGLESASAGVKRGTCFSTTLIFESSWGGFRFFSSFQGKTRELRSL